MATHSSSAEQRRICVLPLVGSRCFGAPHSMYQADFYDGVPLLLEQCAGAVDAPAASAVLSAWLPLLLACQSEWSSFSASLAGAAADLVLWGSRLQQCEMPCVVLRRFVSWTSCGTAHSARGPARAGVHLVWQLVRVMRSASAVAAAAAAAAAGLQQCLRVLQVLQYRKPEKVAGPLLGSALYGPRQIWYPATPSDLLFISVGPSQVLRRQTQALQGSPKSHDRRPRRGVVFFNWHECLFCPVRLALGVKPTMALQMPTSDEPFRLTS